MIIRNFSNIRLYCTSKLKSYYVTTPIFYVNACKFDPAAPTTLTIHNNSRCNLYLLQLLISGTYIQL